MTAKRPIDWRCPRCPNHVRLHVTPSQPPVCTNHPRPQAMTKENDET